MGRAAGARPRVAVVGSGVLGVSTAAQLARRGAEVTLLTESGLASGASGRSLAWLNSAGGYSPEYHRLRLLGLDRYRELAARAGAPGWLRFDGGLGWSAPGDAGSRRAAFAHLQQVGYPAQWLDRAEVAARVPGVDGQAVPGDGALFTPAEGWVELPALVHRLAADLVAHGGRVLTGAGRCAVEVAGRGVRGVRTADRRGAARRGGAERRTRPAARGLPGGPVRALRPRCVTVRRRIVSGITATTYITARSVLCALS